MWIWFLFNNQQKEATQVKKSTDADVVKVANEIIKDGIKLHSNIETLRGASVFDNVQYVSNFNILMRMDEKRFEEIPEVKGDDRYHFDKIMYEVIDSGVLENDMVVEFPTYAELKEGLAKSKAEAKATGCRGCSYVYKFENGLTLQVKYVMWAVKATGSRIAHINKSLRGGVVMQGNGVTMFILPINISPTRPVGFSYQR